MLTFFKKSCSWPLTGSIFALRAAYTSNSSSEVAEVVPVFRELKSLFEAAISLLADFAIINKFIVSV